MEASYYIIKNLHPNNVEEDILKSFEIGSCHPQNTIVSLQSIAIAMWFVSNTSPKPIADSSTPCESPRAF